MDDQEDPLCLPMWVRVWRVGLQPQFSDAGLLALGKALADDDPRLLQGQTTSPPPMQCAQDWPAAGACATAFCGWQGDGLATVGEVEDYFGRVCFEADRRMGDPAAVRWLLNYWDDTPRGEARHALLAEVRRELVLRKLWLGSDAGAAGMVSGETPGPLCTSAPETPAAPVFLTTQQEVLCGDQG